MNISECVDALIDLQKGDMQYLLDTLTYKTEIADILQKLLDTGGVSDEYREVEK